MLNKLTVLFLIQMPGTLLCSNDFSGITVFKTDLYSDLALHCIDNNLETESALIWLNNRNNKEISNDMEIFEEYIWKSSNGENFMEGVDLKTSLDFSLEHTGFVLDRRWIDFQEIRTDGSYFYDLISIPSQSSRFTIDFSLRIRENGYVYISDDYDPVKANNSYFLIFGGWNNNSIGLRRCFQGEMNEDIYNYPRGDCYSVRAIGKGTVSLSEWNHFRIERNENEINVYQYVDHAVKQILTFYETNMFSPVRAAIRSRGLGYWKLHDYEFYAIKEKRIQSKEFYVSSERLCIKVYIKTCFQCSIKLEIWSSKSKMVSKITTQGKNWEPVILRSEHKVQNVSLKLIVVADITHPLDEYFIGNIINCGQNELYSIQTNQIDEMPYACCYSIKHQINVCPLLHLILPAPTNITSIDTYHRCPEETFGRNCFPCDTFNNCKFGEKYCEKSPSGDLECKCYDGYKGKYCYETCSIGYYGRACKNQCNFECAECDSLGKCTKFYQPILVKQPEILFIGETNITIRADFNYKGLVAPDRYEIQLKNVSQGSYSFWYAIEDVVYPNNTTKDIHVESLSPSTKYQIRIIFTTKNKLVERKESTKTVEFKTKCRDILKSDVKYLLNGTALSVIFNPEVCPLYDIRINEDKFENVLLKNDITYLLEKCTNYSISVYKNDVELYKYNFQTIENNETIHCLLSNQTNTTSTIQWVHNTDAIFDYTVGYKFIGSLYKQCKQSSIPKQLAVKEPLVNIGSLRPYSEYEVEIKSQSQKSTRKTTIVTKQSEHISWEEIDILPFIQENRLLYVSFSVNCNQVKGPITINISVTCWSRWCSKMSPYNQLIKRDIELSSPYEYISFDVIGLTEYNIKISAKRNGSKTSFKEYFITTNETSSGPVLNAKIYSKTKNSLSVRFKPPYPKMGALTSYKINYKHLYGNGSLEYKLSRCKLWLQYNCVELHGLEENMEYVMEIVPINSQDLPGESTVIKGFTKQDKPEPPEFLYLTWINDHQFLRVEFPHPLITNGPLTNYSLFIDNEKHGEIVIDNEEKSYTFHILKWKPAANITIGVRVANEAGRSDVIQNITSTLPLIPHINTAAIDLKENVSSIIINVPKLEVNNHVKCFMAVIVTKLSTESEHNLDFLSLADRKVLEEVQSPQNYLSWVAWKNNITNNQPLTICVGDDTGNNRILFENTKYNITIYIKRTYNYKTSATIWWKEVTTLIRNKDNDCLPIDLGFSNK